MFSLQWLKLMLPIIGEYLKEFINPTAEENKTTRAERIVALIIAVLVLCLTSILDKTMELNKELAKSKTELVETKRKVVERDRLIENIKFYLDRCDARIDDISATLLKEAEPIEVTVETVEMLEVQHPSTSNTTTIIRPAPKEPTKSPEEPAKSARNLFLLNLITGEKRE